MVLQQKVDLKHKVVVRYDHLDDDGIESVAVGTCAD